MEPDSCYIVQYSGSEELYGVSKYQLQKSNSQIEDFETDQRDELI